MVQALGLSPGFGIFGLGFGVYKLELYRLGFGVYESNLKFTV
jgi:hypothetical protein